MITSTITSKGQTTIPLSVRERLGVAEHDRLGYEFRDNGDVVLRPLRGNLLSLRGSVKSRQHPENWTSVRNAVRTAVAKRAMERGA